MRARSVDSAVALADWVDPEAAFAAVTRGAAHAFWLDAGPDAVAGWSWLGVGELEADAGAVRAVDLTAAAAQPIDGVPFRSGWVGWFDYDSGAAAAGAPAPDPGDGAGRWLRVRTVLAFDHARRRVWAMGEDAVAFAERAASASALPPPPAAPVSRAMSRDQPDEYANLIAQCQEHIRDGDAYQLCLTTRFDVTADVDPWQAYRRLRRASRSHHGGFVRAGTVALLSATPERFLEVSGGTVTTRPIKGTRPRGATAEADAALAADLAVDVKERAENVMIVDLVRNDLSRVCVPGSVGVDRLLAVETYPLVHQLVSTVSGSLVAGTTLGALIDATFPAGSMTGAPKLSAMTILHALERSGRGAYAGCFGWVGDDGAVDLAMLIRSVLVTPTGASVGAGGGITWRSEPSAEVAEVGLKARAPLAAIGAVPPPGW